MTGELSPHEREAVGRISGLVLANAMIFHEVLADQDHRITPLQDLLDADLPNYALADHWGYIVREINYYPIFHIAGRLLSQTTANPDLFRILSEMADAARQVVGMRAALKHDLMGRVYHRLLADRKYLATYYTGIPAALLLLKLALQGDRYSIDWHDLDQVRQIRVGDLACGTGTLLMASADAITDNYVPACAHQAKPVDLRALHKVLAEEVLNGYDVLPSALHLTASTLALRDPEVLLSDMRLFSLPLAGEDKRLGSVEFLLGDKVQIQRNLFSETPLTRKLTPSAEHHPLADLPKLDLCVMNPPFTRSVGGNLLFGSAPEKERKQMQRRLKEIVAQPEVFANITAGLGSVFVAAAHKHLKEGGRIALVLPKALLSRIAWNDTRELFRRHYRVEYIVASHDPLRWNFSESTSLSEVLLVAQRQRNNARANNAEHVTAVNLWRNPGTSFEALAIARDLIRTEPPDIAEGQGASQIGVGEEKMGEAVCIPWADLRDQYSWLLPCAFAQSDLIRVALQLTRGQLWLPGSRDTHSMPFCPLSEIGKLGPDRRDIRDGFRSGKSPTPYPAFWGHDSRAVCTLAQGPNRYLTPLARAKKGRNLRKAVDLWPRAGSLLIAERLRLNSQRLAAVLTDQAVLSNVWWPFSLTCPDGQRERERALNLWLASSLGFAVLLVHRVETEGAWVDFKKPLLAQMPVLNVGSLSDECLAQLSSAYDRLCGEPLGPFPEMASDPVRARIDEAVSAALALPDFSVIRHMLAREPIVCLERL